MSTHTMAKLALIAVAVLLFTSLQMLAIRVANGTVLFPWQHESPYVAKIIAPANAQEDDFATLQLVVFDRQADGDIRLVYRTVAP